MKRLTNRTTTKTLAFTGLAVALAIATAAMAAEITGNETSTDGLYVTGSHPNAQFSEPLRVEGSSSQYKIFMDDKVDAQGGAMIRMRASDGSGGFGVGDFGYKDGFFRMASSGSILFRAGQNAAQRPTAEHQFVVGAGVTGLIVKPDGKVGVNMTEPTTDFEVNGEASMNVVNIKGADLAERFEIAGDESLIVPGAVTSIDPDTPGGLIISNGAYDRTVAGVISGAGGLRAGMRLSQEGTLAHGDHLVALTGRVYVQAVGGANGIQLGDMLTTADVPGHAMAVTDYDQARGAVLGKAMTTLAPGETGMVLCLITLQ